MPTLRDRVERRDRAQFVGRAAELEFFDALLDGTTDVSVVYLSGPGGIGKSALLREVARRARTLGYTVAWLEGRDLPPFPEVVSGALTDVIDAERPLIIIDSFELVSSLEGYLRDVVVPGLPDRALVVIASRVRPSRSWFDGGWDTVVAARQLDGLDHAEVRQLAANLDVDAAVVDELVQRSEGSPLAVAVAAATGLNGSLADVAGRLLGDEVDTDRFRTLSVAAMARVTTPGLLAAVFADQDTDESYKWLADRSFCEPLADGVALHSLVGKAVLDSLRRQDPAGEADLRRRVADALYQRAVNGQFSLSTDLQHLVIDPTVRWGYSLDIGSRYHIDAVTPRDVEQIGTMLRSVGMDEWWAITEVFFTQHPECCGVARDNTGAVGGYFVAVTPSHAPAAAERDVLLGPWLRHARDVLHSDSAVLWREAVDLTGSLNEITALLGAGGLVGSGVVNPRYCFLPISPSMPAALRFSEALGAVHVPELDVVAHGMNLQCHVADFGPRGVLGAQRDWVYRETGAAPPDGPPTEPVNLLRLLRDPAAMANGPAWLGDRPSEKMSAARALVAEALNVFGPSRSDWLAREIIELAYLTEVEPHEAIARRLNLSRSAYFRRLHAATARVADELTHLQR